MKLVTFGEAITALKTGKTVFRQCWAGTKLQLIPELGLQDAFIRANLWNGRQVSWIPTQDDIINDDWIVE